MQGGPESTAQLQTAGCAIQQETVHSEGPPVAPEGGFRSSPANDGYLAKLKGAHQNNCRYNHSCFPKNNPLHVQRFKSLVRVSPGLAYSEIGALLPVISC